VRGAVGLGYRRQLEPGWKLAGSPTGVNPQRPDNMFSISCSREPKYLYFSERNSADAFVLPQDTWELTGRVGMRWDQLERNLMDLAHEGFAAGFDATYGWRTNWEDWGLDASRHARDGRYPKQIKGYLVGATGVPALNERHRLIGMLHGGKGWDLDRFSQPRVGGGPRGNEFLSLARPILAGRGDHRIHAGPALRDRARRVSLRADVLRLPLGVWRHRVASTADRLLDGTCWADPAPETNS
jgi:hypothetical protein